MIRPVNVFGSPVLRRVANEIPKDYPNLTQIVDDMYETMYKSEGIGLAAPQVGLSIRLFITDATPLVDENPEAEGFKKVFINPKIVDRSEEQVLYNEGCLSLPGLREDVQRSKSVKIEYLDLDFNPIVETYEGLPARIIQHEYDHLEGILFTDRISAIKRQLLKGKLNGIAKGKFSATYKCKVG